jgi:hypothetical protein
MVKIRLEKLHHTLSSAYFINNFDIFLHLLDIAQCHQTFKVAKFKDERNS